MSNTNTKLAVFDFEGTVVDTSIAATRAFVEMLDFYDIERISAKKIAPYIAMPSMQMVKELLYDPSFPSDFYHRATFKYEALYREIMEEKTKLFRGFKKLLKDLVARDIAVCMVSSQNYELVSENIDVLEATDYFDFIVAADQFEYPKPATDMLEQLMLVTGTEPDQTVMIGDEPVDIEMGKAAGVTTISVQWGYSTPKVIQDAAADFTVSKPVDLEALLISDTPNN